MYTWALNPDDPHTWSSGEGPNSIPIQKVLYYEIKQNYIRLQQMEDKKWLEQVLFSPPKNMFATYPMMHWQMCIFLANLPACMLVLIRQRKKRRGEKSTGCY
jgi:hypothetical protein